MNPTGTLPEALIARLPMIRSIGAITGAGVSSESGLPTYRGRGGLYDDPAEGARTVEALSGSTLARDPDRTWRTVADLARQAGAAQPGDAHRALARIEALAERFTLLTQNVDGLHHAAGSRNVIEIHGNIFDTRCLGCHRPGRMTVEDWRRITRAPRCPRCDGLLRPRVVLFGELLPDEPVRRLREEFYLDVPDLVIVAGTSAMFPYIMEPAIHARAAGRMTVEINPEATDLSGEVDYTVRAPAGVALTELAGALRRR